MLAPLSYQRCTLGIAQFDVDCMKVQANPTDKADTFPSVPYLQIVNILSQRGCTAS